MANLIVTEFHGVHSVSAQVAAGLIASQVVAIGGTSAATPNPINGGATLIRLFAEADCTVSIGISPVATASNHIPMSAGSEYYHGVSIDSGLKVAVISRAAA